MSEAASRARRSVDQLGRVMAARTTTDGTQAARERTSERAKARGALSRSHWDSSPFVATLRDASCGFPNDPLLAPHLPEIIKDVYAERAAHPHPPKFKFQRAISHRLLVTLYSDSIPKLLARR